MSMKGRSRSVISTAMALVVLLIIPIMFWKYIRSSLVPEFVAREWSTTPVELWEGVITYLSMGFTLLLGIIVYHQSQKINNLDSSQYDIFIGIDKLDYSIDFKDVLIKDYDYNSEFSIIQSFSEEKLGFLTALNVHVKGDDIKDKIVFIPLSLITKNHLLITSIDFKKISLAIYSKSKEIYQQDFYNYANPYYTILGDSSRFSFGVGMVLPSNTDISKISISIHYEIGDQINRTHKKSTSVDLERISDNYYLSSSKSA